MSTTHRDPTVPLVPGVVPDRRRPVLETWIGTAEAGRILGIAANSVRCHCVRGTCPIPFRRGFGGRSTSFTFRLTDVLAWRDRRNAR